MVKHLARRSLLAVVILNGACAGSWAGGPSEKAAAQATAAADTQDLVTDAISSVFRGRWRGEAQTSVTGQAGRAKPPGGLSVLVDRDRGTAGHRSAKGQSQIDSATRPAHTPCGPSPATTTEVVQLIVDAAHRHGVEPQFALAIATAESRLDRDRNSSKGARGAMQLMPSTADDLGVRDVCDPAQNIDGGVRLLRSLLDTYRNPLIAAAAYNAGQANVRRYGGIPPFPETVRFVAEVVNRQLGLPTPMTSGSVPAAPTVATDNDDPASPTPIGGTSRQWVRGVMQF